MYKPEILKEIQSSRHKFIISRWEIISEKFTDYYNWPNLDPIRNEICFCLLYGLDQSAISMTNHLLESLLKYACILKSGMNQKQSGENSEVSVVDWLKNTFSPPIESIMDKNLAETINLAFSLKLITKPEKSELHNFRVNYRNAFSHADKKKLFKDETSDYSEVQFKETGEIEIKDSRKEKISDILTGQGLFQRKFAGKYALEYFFKVDDYVRKIKIKLFP